ncbi:BC_2427 family protein [Viridibacillus sp. NPDC093762]|uniref:BC_2427 family protein n=1 Tax=Viridibacillus sp. NPDC093762 TaxID=3390720 RepID=UPI003D07051C
MDTPLIFYGELKRIQSQQQNNYKNQTDQELYQLQNNDNDSIHTKSLTESIEFDDSEKDFSCKQIDDCKQNKKSLNNINIPSKRVLPKIKYRHFKKNTNIQQRKLETLQADSEDEIQVIHSFKELIEDKEERNVTPPSNLENIYSKENIIPFTIFFEIDDFLRLPISGNIVQQSALLLEGVDQAQQSENHSQFIHTELSWPDPIQYRLVHSTINEIISFTTENEMQHAENRIYETIANPIHISSPKKKGKPECKHNHIEVRVSVVVGEYEIEINMSNQVFFEQEVLGFKEISRNVELRSFKFTPVQYCKSLGDGTCTVSKGKIALKGEILQKLRYSANTNQNASQQKQKNIRLHQRMALKLTVHLSQIQKIKATLCDE